MEQRVRRDEILATARRLFFEHGYENTSVATIIEAVGVAKGTFYHHFKSKEELLQELVSQGFEEILPRLRAIADNPGMSAMEKLLSVFEAASNWKIANRELIIQMLVAMQRTENVLLRRKTYELSRKYYAPIISQIVTQGVREGVFDTEHPEEAGEVIYALSLSMNDEIAELFLAAVDNPEMIDLVLKKAQTFEYAMERIIGAPKGSLRIMDRKVIELFRTEKE